MLVGDGVLLAMAPIDEGDRAEGDHEGEPERPRAVRRGEGAHGEEERHHVAEKAEQDTLELAGEDGGVDVPAMHALQVDHGPEAQHRDAEEDEPDADRRAVVQHRRPDARGEAAVDEHAERGEDEDAADDGDGALLAVPRGGETSHVSSLTSVRPDPSQGRRFSRI